MDCKTGGAELVTLHLTPHSIVTLIAKVRSFRVDPNELTLPPSPKCNMLLFTHLSVLCVLWTNLTRRKIAKKPKTTASRGLG